jgi:hypothetical protein
MNDQDHSLSLSDPDRSLVLSHLLVNFLKNLVSCQTSFSKETFLTPIRIGLSSLFSCQPLFILKMQVLLQCNSLATAANDQFSSSFAIALSVCIGERFGI